MHCLQEDLKNHNRRIHMPLRFISLTVLLFGLTSCIGLKPKPDNTKIYALGLSDPAQSSSDMPIVKGYIARPQLPVYMEGYGLKNISDEREIVDISDARWAESVDIGVARAMSYYIETLSGGLKSDFYPWVRTDDAIFILQLNFHHLIATNDGRILISVNWECNYAGGETETGFFANNTLEWSGDAQSMVDGTNTALELLAAEIVDALKKEVLAAKEY
jgi:uncharacterized lipoprotein YmbA